jgi:hypothetical protein
MGDYNSNNRFWLSTSSAPPVGIGSDITAPVLSAQSASSVTQTTATLNFTSGEAGTYFYLIYASATSAPDSSTVISQGASAPTVVKGTSSATASANTVSVTGLTAGTAYKAYVVVRDSSGNVSSISTISLTTVVASPAFTLTSSSETRTYGTSGTAFSANSTGGLVASYSISATPAGMSFDTSTGTLTGAPTTIAAATTYTITATNVSGTATRTFVLTVTARPITIKAANKTATYTGVAASVSNSYTITSGTLAGSESFTALTYTYTSSPLSYNSQTAPTNAATYTITPSAASFSVGSASNYSITYETGTLTINKADSITVTATPSTTTYNASAITPAYVVSGLKSAETATATSNFIGINGTSYGGGTTCETGGACSLGQTGPGGGIVFYDAGSTQSWGRYLEVAPVSWSAPSATADITAPWGCDGTLIGASGSSIGSGFTNTNLILANCATAGIAARLVRAYAGGSKLDWSLPSTGELRALCAFATSGTASSCTGSASPRLGLAGNGTYYYSSTEISSGGTDKFRMSDGQFTSAGKNSSTNLVRPIRAFDLVPASAITTPPTDAGSYRYTVSDIVLSAGASLSNYQGVIYESATVTINKAFQAKLSIGQYQAFSGISTYPLNVYGGTGTGLLTRTLTDTGTANCTLSSDMFVTASNVGICTVRAVKNGGINYFTETATVTIYWMSFIDRYINVAPSTPTDLGLSGSTAFTKLTYETFTVLSFANGSGSAVTSASIGSILRIIGTGFNASDSTTEVFFGMTSVSAPLLAFNVTNPLANYIQLTVPVDAETDRVIIRSTKGWATSPGILTITPIVNI